MSCDARCPDRPWRRELRPISLLRASNCLDHSQLMPGVTVGEAAVLGTRTLAHQDACFPPDSISTGAVNGRSVLLRTEASAHAPPKDRAEELRVMRMLESPVQWASFNLAQLLSGFVAYALPQFAWVIATDLVFAIEAYLTEQSHVGVANMDQDSAARLATPHKSSAEMVNTYWTVWLVAYLTIEVSLLFLAAAMKWAVMGEYKEENHTFFSSFHYRWAVMLNFKGAMAPLGDHLSGTAFQAWYYRLMGAKIGKDAYLAGIALEFDLLEVGDGAAVNDDCDATAHTVERMVLKMAPVRIQANSAMLNGSVVMPGALLGRGALLLERSQVLKGDEVRDGEVWAGQPAKRVFGKQKRAAISA
jgi:acetyltransferase-like isoleucine patch superfamily enzyme